MTLPEFMEAKGLNQDALAGKLGVDQGTVSRMLRRGTASVGLALKVESLTEGKVRADDLSDDVATVRAALRHARAA